jgi:hypothetical protein
VERLLDHGQKPLRGGADGGGSRPCSSSTPDFSITTCARSSTGPARGILDGGDAVGVGTATACGGGGVGLTDRAVVSSGGGVGVFSGFGVSSSFEVPFPFAAFLCSEGSFFFRVFFFADFGFGVGLADFFDFFEAAVGSGVSLGFGFGAASSFSPDFFAKFDLGGRGDSPANGEAPISFAELSVPKVFGVGLGDSFAVADVPLFSIDSSVARFAFRIGGDDSSGVPEASCFFFDLFAAALAFAIGLGDFFGAGDEAACVSCCPVSDSSRWLFSLSLTWARRRLPAIAPNASAVASQRRKRTTAAERIRVRDVINPEASCRDSLKKNYNGYKGRTLLML